MKNMAKKSIAKPINKALSSSKKALLQENEKRPPQKPSIEEEDDSVLSEQSNKSGADSADGEEGEMVYSSGSGDDVSGDEDDDSQEGDEQLDEAKESGGDGFANVLNKILNQNIGNKNPVLAKRKTQIMKEQEAHSQEVREEKRRRLNNKQEREKQMVAPSYITLDYERQLKKVATRGVIALFNAIHKAKKEDVEADEKGHNASKSAPTSAASDIKALTQEKFLELLKHGKAGDSSENKKDAPSTLGNKGMNSKQVVESAKGWGAVKDDFLLDKKIALKDWDKESDSEDGAADFADDDHVEIGSDVEAERAAPRSAGHHRHAGAKRSGGKARR